jgi:HSP20 family molecular chaperone IbpA
MADQTTRPGGQEPAEQTRSEPTFAPATDIYETEAGLILVLDMPGVAKDSVNVTLDKRVLTVTGRSAQHAPSDFTLVHAEYQGGVFERSFTISEAVDGERISASMRNGVLRLLLPKAKAASARRIPVSTG